MTSDLNDKIIKSFFETHNYFAYPKEDIFFFEQGLEPCLSYDEKLLIESDRSLCMAPDGNGGIYNALNRTGALTDMLRRGVEHLHVYGIDNVLTKAADPAFIGLCISKGAECGNKVVWRDDKSEKVGVTVEVDCRMNIIEYSEIGTELGEATDASGKLIYGAANICNHYLSVEFIRRVMPDLKKMYHIADKKIAFYDPLTKLRMVPESNNGMKLEMFIFDIFQFAEKWIVLEVNREDEFAPVKNAPGSCSDSPDTARILISAQAKRWLQAAGANIEDVTPPAACELSPLLTYFGEDLDEFSGQVLVPPFYLE